jgi:hypothetical protein
MKDTGLDSQILEPSAPWFVEAFALNTAAEGRVETPLKETP